MSYKKKQLWLLVPGLLGFLLFYLAPFIYSFYFSMVDNTFNRKFVRLSNFVMVIKNKYFRLALKNTFEFTGVGVPILVFISFILAILMVNQSDRMSVARMAFVIPILLPSAAIVAIWQILFCENSFIIKSLTNNITWFHNIGLYKIPIYLFFIWKSAGYNMILFISGLLSIPHDIYEACEMDGASGLKKHLYITFPLLLPTTFFVFIISMVNSFKIFKEVYLLYGAYPDTSIYFVQHYMNNHFHKLNYQNLATGAIIFAIIVYIIVALGYKAENRLSKGVWG